MTAVRVRWRWLAGVAVITAVVFGLVWFQPHKLLIDDRVDEALPVAVTAARPGRTPTTGALTDVARGSFVSLDHATRGDVRVLDLGDVLVVRLEDLDTSNGPDLRVYLSTNAAAGAEGAFDDDFVELGRLKGNVGDQNYDVPAGTDIARYRSVVVWCDRFDSAFGAADLVGA